jgi:ubiquinone/menaquinone biosynthesis C-methylase UbiE
MMSISNAKIIAEFWDANMGKHITNFDNWETPEPICKHQNLRVTGDADINPIDWFYKKYGPFPKMAVICSGTGILEQHVGRIKSISESIIGHDISEKSVEMARTSCADLHNVFFKVADINTYEWPENEYNVLFAHGALHHIEAIDWCITQIKKTLTTNGLLYVNDYVGPKRFQWTDLQMDYANKLLEDVPKQWKLKDQVIRCDPQELQKNDPSEAVCTDEIESCITENFEIVNRKPRGGTLLAPIFGSGCLDARILNSSEGIQCLKNLALNEGELIDCGLIPSDHVVIVAKKRIH